MYTFKHFGLCISTLKTTNKDIYIYFFFVSKYLRIRLQIISDLTKSIFIEFQSSFNFTFRIIKIIFDGKNIVLVIHNTIINTYITFNG